MDGGPFATVDAILLDDSESVIVAGEKEGDATPISSLGTRL